MSLFLGIDTSNYTTSAALLDTVSGEMRQAKRPLAVPPGALGLRQNETVFQHIKALPELVSAWPLRDVSSIGVSARPRDVEGSYMPCFVAGESAARLIGGALGVPVYDFSHQAGHLAAAAFSAGRTELLEAPFLAWHVSGGTTEFLRVAPSENGVFLPVRVGGTRDLTAGQLIDRTGVLLGLDFPAGQALETLCAGEGESFPVRVEDAAFSLSGLQNKVETMEKQGAEPAHIAFFAIESVGNALVRATRQGQEKYPGLPVLCAGGVMSNRRIRARLETLGALFCQPAFSADNAAGAAFLASRRVP